MPVISSLTQILGIQKKALILSSSTAQPLFYINSTIGERPSSVAVGPISERPLVLPNEARILQKLIVNAICRLLDANQGIARFTELPLYLHSSLILI